LFLHIEHLKLRKVPIKMKKDCFTVLNPTKIPWEHDKRSRYFVHFRLGEFVEPKVLFFIDETESEKFRAVLEKYWKFFRRKTATEAKDLAESSYNNLIRGMDLVGNILDPSELAFFDDLLSRQTDHFYTPTDAHRKRFKKGVRLKKGRAKRGTTANGSDGLSDDDRVKLDRIRGNLVSEYPFLDRRDLEESIENYCKLIVKINNVMAGDIVANNVAIKNLTDTMIRLGGFLGIDEEKKAKQKALEDKQSVASLSAQFQQTLDNYPALMDRMRYEEIRILLEKFDSNSLGISKELFESPAYAAMQLIDAREFVKERESRYEQKNA